MIRITKLIGKDDLFNVMLMDTVTKVELLNSENKTLTNPNVCRVNLYLRININDLPTIIGNCKSSINTHPKWKKGNKGFVTGFCSSLNDNFIKWSNIKKLRIIGEEESISFSIPTYYDELVSKFDHYKFG